MTLGSVNQIKCLTTDTEIRRLVEQLNVMVKSVNTNFELCVVDVNSLSAISFSHKDILVDQFGDVVTQDGEVVLGL